MLNVAICDDDWIFQSRLSELTREVLEKEKVDACIQIFSDGNKIIEDFKTKAQFYNLVILDIEMPAINGKAVAEQLRAINSDFRLVFVTSFETEVYDIFQYKADSFVCKAQIDSRFQSEVLRVLRGAQQDADEIAVFEVADGPRRKTIRFPTSDILYFECLNKKVYLHTLRSEYQLLHTTYLEIQNEYLDKNFVAIHRNCIVNIKYIFSINDIDVDLDNQKKLPLSRRYKRAVVEKFMSNVKEGVCV